MTDILDDYHAWQAYPHYRWIFNKLEVSLRLGYHAGPAGIPVQRTGYYIIRPVYNPYGMGIGAHKKWLSADWQDDMSNHAHIPRGLIPHHLQLLQHHLSFYHKLLKLFLVSHCIWMIKQS